jgi:hypothetical protein
MEQFKNEHKYNLFYGLKNGQLKHISEVENGLKCNCFCAACEKRLVARNKGLKRIHHFAHYESAECKYGVQTSIHLVAKEILEKKGQIKVPKVTIFLNEEIEVSEQRIFISKGHFENLSDDKYIKFDNVILEKKLHKFIPDVVAIVGNKKLIIEIAVTHFVGRQKLQKIIDSKISAIEIDLSKIQNDFNINELEPLIIDNIESKKWLHNQYSVEEKSKRQIELTNSIRKKNQNEERRKTKAEREEWYKKYYKKIINRQTKNGRTIAQIENCPLQKRQYQGQFYANINLDCNNCEHSRNTRENNTVLICLFEYHKYKADKKTAYNKRFGNIGG